MPRRPEYSRQPLRRERFVAVVDTDHPFARRASVGLEEFAGQTFSFYARNFTPAHHDKVTAMLAETGRSFRFRQDPVPGPRSVDLEDGASFTLVPESMAGSVGGSNVALALSDTASDLDLELVWRRDRASRATTALLATAQELAQAEGWLAR
jgi:DNA-binding transcriptional LysR family regulator